MGYHALGAHPMPETSTFDLFISHRSVEKAALQPLRDALTARRLRVWVDDAEIDPFSPDIAVHLQQGLARSRMLLAWASPAWRASRGCQWELTAAAVASEALGDGTAGRLLMVCPQGLGPVPEALRGARHWTDPSDATAIAAAVAERLAQIDDRPLEAAARTGEVRCLGGTSFDPPRFLGRDDSLWEIHGALAGRAAARVTGRLAHDIAVLRGLGGVGKTMLAREYGARFSAAYPGGIVLLRGREALSTQLVELLIELDEPVPKAVKHPDQTLSERLFIKALRASVSAALDGVQPGAANHERPRGRILWLVDDLPSDPHPPELDAWRCPVVDGRTLITTRSGRWTGTGAVISLDALERDAARALLWTGAGGPPPANDTAFADGEAILDALGDHALSVDVARALLIRLGVRSVRETVTSAPAGFDTLAEGLAEDLPTGHEKAISSTLRASFEGLDEGARDLLRASAVLAAAPIPRDLLESALTTAGWTDMVDRFKAFEQTTAESLMRIETTGRTGAEPSLRVHPVVSRAVPLLDTSPKRTAVLERALHDRIADQMRPWAPFPWEHGRIRGLLPHAEHLGSRAQDGEGELALLAAVTHRTDGNYRAALALETATFEARRRKYGVDHADTLTALHSLASTISAAGDIDTGRQRLEEVLERRRAVLGPDHPDTLTSLAALWWIPLLEKDQAKAQQLAEEVLKKRRRVLGAEHPDTLWSELTVALTMFVGVGDALRIAEHALELLHRPDYSAPPPLVLMANVLKAMALSLDDRKDEARTLLEREVWPTIRRMQAVEQAEGQSWSATEFVQAVLIIEDDVDGLSQAMEATLERRRKTLGAEHALTLAALDAVASNRVSNHDLAGAQTLYEEALEIRRRKWPGGSLTLLTIDNLADILTVREDPAARQLREEALATRQHQLGLEHAATLSAASALADTLRALGDLDAARAMQEDLVSAYRRIHGPEHPDTLTAMIELSDTLGKLGRMPESRELETEVLGVWTRLHVEGPDWESRWRELTDTLNWKLRFAEDRAWARPFQEHVLSVRRRALGSDHVATLEAIDDLTSTLQAVGELVKARELGVEQLATSQRVRGADHPDTINAMRKLASTLHLQQDFAAERPLREAVVAAPGRAAAAPDLKTLTDLLDLAEVLAASGDAGKAQSRREEAIRGWIRLGAPDDIQAWELGSVLRWKTDRAWACPFQEEVVAVRKKALGADATATLAALEDLASSQEELRLLDEARRSLEELVAGRRRALGPDHSDTVRAETALARLDSLIRKH